MKFDSKETYFLYLIKILNLLNLEQIFLLQI